MTCARLSMPPLRLKSVMCGHSDTVRTESQHGESAIKSSSDEAELAVVDDDDDAAAADVAVVVDDDCSAIADCDGFCIAVEYEAPLPPSQYQGRDRVEMCERSGGCGARVRATRQRADSAIRCSCLCDAREKCRADSDCLLDERQRAGGEQETAWRSRRAAWRLAVAVATHELEEDEEEEEVVVVAAV